MPSARLQEARQHASDANAALAGAHARIRELETIAEALNRRLCEANERAEAAESHAARAFANAERP
jgi:predicted  nucleic acid-binding Zn-ribbon protein